MKITIFSGPYPVDDALGGIGLRLWEHAQVLADRGAQVTIVTCRPSPFTWPGVELTVFDEATWPGVVASSDAIITTDLPDTRVLLHARDHRVLTIVENAPPIEHLHFEQLRQAADPAALYGEIVVRYELQLLLADLLLVRSEPERTSTLGALALTGRLASLVQADADPSFTGLISLVPIGFNQHSAAAAAHAADTSTPGVGGSVRRVDAVWNGGIWSFCRPDPLWPALTRDRALTARILYPPTGAALENLRGDLETAGVADQVDLVTQPVPHRSRDGLLAGAGAMVCLAAPGAENDTCHRLRLRDALLYRLPVVIDQHGGSGAFVARHRIGAAIDPADPAALAAALAAASRPGPARDRYLTALATVAAAHQFEGTTEGMWRFLQRGRHAADYASPAHDALLRAAVAAHPYLSKPPTPLL